MTYDAANRMKTYNGEEVTYDAEGNMTYGPSADGTMTEYTYNCRNQLIKADHVTYEYDAESNRTAQTDRTTGARTEYVTDTVNELSRVLTAKTTVNEKEQVTTYIYGDGLLIQSSEEGYWTFHYNNIGSTMLLTDENGEVEETYTYGPYGELLSGDATKTAYLYNGKYGVSTDANGLYYMRARYYNVSIKRFLNQDIVNGSITNSQSLNKFSYVQGNPIKLTDPFGLCPSNSIGHFILDMIGFIPIVGDIADAVNAIWYAMEGDYWSATMSAVSVLPIIGSMVGVGGKTAIKIGKSIKNGEKIGDIIKSVEKNAGKTVGDVAEKAGTKAAKEAAEKVAEEVAEKGTKKTASEAAGDVGKSGKYSNATFATEDKLVSHFEKHGNEFKGIYNSADEYLQGARDVMNNGYKVEYSYKGETRVGYVQFMGNNSKGKAKFAFVGTNNEGYITTFHTESGKTFWKLLNEENIPVINPK